MTGPSHHAENGPVRRCRAPAMASAPRGPAADRRNATARSGNEEIGSPPSPNLALRRQQTSQRTQQRGLSGTIRPDQRNKISAAIRSETSRRICAVRQRDADALRTEIRAVRSCHASAKRAPLADDQIEKERHADHRGEHADLDIGGRRNDRARPISAASSSAAPVSALGSNRRRRIVSDQRAHQSAAPQGR